MKLVLLLLVASERPISQRDRPQLGQVYLSSRSPARTLEHGDFAGHEALFADDHFFHSLAVLHREGRPVHATAAAHIHALQLRAAAHFKRPTRNA